MHARRIWAVLTACSLTLVLGVATAGSARAQNVPGAITQVTVSNVNNVITTKETWHVPDGTRAGDTFVQTVPAQLADLPGAFALPTATGAVVANAVLSGVVGDQRYTFTLTSFVESHGDVHGTFSFTGDTIPRYTGTTAQLVYIGSDQRIFRAAVAIPKVRVNHAVALVTGGLHSATNCSTTGKDCFHWQVETGFGPFDDSVIVDHAGAHQSFDCASAVVHIGPTNGNSTGINTPRVDASATISCSPTMITVHTGSIALSSEIVELDVFGNVTDIPNHGAVRYRNTSTVTTTSAARGVTKHDAKAYLTSPGASGTGIGRQGAIVTRASAPQAASSSARPASSSQRGLSGTGARFAVLLGIAVLLLGGGAALLVIARRRRNSSAHGPA